MADKQKDLYLQKGKSQPLIVRCETAPIVYKEITAIQRTAPVRIVVPSHGLVDGWRVAVTNAGGMTAINAEANNVRERDYHPATVVDGNTITLNDVDAAGFKEYTGGGFIQYNTPFDLTGYKARFQIREKKGGATVIFEMTTEDGLIEIDTDLNTVTLYFDAADMSAIAVSRGYHELELYKTVSRTVNGVTVTGENVHAPIEGNVYFSAETVKGAQ